MIGIIKPINNDKGSQTDVDIYRGITILSCMGKLFTVILNERLKLWHGKIKNGAAIFFACQNGVKQDENLSPLLFGIFLNDLIKYISSKYQGLTLLLMKWSLLKLQVYI